MKTLKEGSIVEVNRKFYVVKKALAGRCVGCAAFEKVNLCNTLPYCGDIMFQDYIIFQKQDQNLQNFRIKQNK
ncbi:MAG: hypothetical protein LBG28_14850 [Tannerella sp.]|jgi:hypothetical protein|nr:hypothetical protein [Tannerella sp.]